MNHELKSKSSRKRVTIHLVTKEAGVSASTVSRVLTGNGAVEELACHPNQIARSLKNRETCTLG